MTPCIAAAEQKANFFIEAESYFLHFKVRRFEDRKRQYNSAFDYGNVCRPLF